MSFPRYPKYKTSGVEWLGEVPEHWEVVRLKGLIAEIDERTGDQDLELLGLSKSLGVVKRSQLTQGASESDNYENYKVAIAGQLVMNKMQAWNGVFGICPIQGMVSPDYAVFRFVRNEFDKFLCSLFRTELMAGVFFTRCRGMGSAFLRLNTPDFLDIKVSLPSAEEARHIAAFLDHETAKIDELVAEQERLIDLLKEKRQAVISHAVTKGLNPDAPMKDSGIEWLGEVPEHWKVVAIKWLSPVRRGASPRPIDDPKYFDEEGEFAWVRIADVSACDGVLNETTQQLSQLGSSLSVKILPGELFVSIAGTVGKPCMSAIKACIHDGFVYFPALKIEPRFLYRIFEGGDCYGGLGKWGTQLNLNTDTVGSIRVALPPEVELNEVLEFLDHETAKFTTLTTEANRVIDLLKERRTALISAAVTGQIDVRNLVSVESA